MSDDTLAAGQSFLLSVMVRNQGDAASNSTRIRFYRSSDATVSTDDTEVGDDNIEALPTSQSKDESENLLSPSESGAYYFGACVDSVANETDTSNKCSSGVRVTVSASDGTVESGELIVESASVSDSTSSVADALTISPTVRNRGTTTTPATTLNFYLSNDAIITTGDISQGTNSVVSLPASGTSDESIRIAAPSPPQPWESPPACRRAVLVPAGRQARAFGSRSVPPMSNRAPTSSSPGT